MVQKEHCEAGPVLVGCPRAGSTQVPGHSAGQPGRSRPQPPPSCPVPPQTPERFVRVPAQGPLLGERRARRYQEPGGTASSEKWRKGVVGTGATALGATVPLQPGTSARGPGSGRTESPSRAPLPRELPAPTLPLLQPSTAPSRAAALRAPRGPGKETAQRDGLR